MATTGRPLIYIEAGAEIAAVPAYANDGAYQAAQGVPTNGSMYLNTTTPALRVFISGAFTDVLIPTNVVSYWLAQRGHQQASSVLANQVFS